METRLDLSEEVLAAAEEQAAAAGRSISKIVEDILRERFHDDRADIYEGRRQRIERDIATAVEEWRRRNPPK
jgi:hypothetical protein